MYEDGTKEYIFTDLKGKVEYNTQLAAFTVKVGTIIEPIYLGNINKKSLKEIWENSSDINYLREIRQNDFKDCTKCSDRGYCLRLP